MATNRKNGTNWRGLALGGALLFAAALAQAQYVWIDDKGLKQYSDRPPPPSVPDKRILKGPGAARQQEPEAAPAAEAVPPAKAAPTTAERNADYRKRKNEEAEKAVKAEEESRHKQDVAANCEAAGRNKAALESGARISTVGKDGERAYLSDEQRARQLQEAQRALANCK